MSTNRILKLQGQGEVQFFELPANGTSKVSMKAPAALAADVAITLPDALPVGTEVLTMSATGVLAYGGGAGAASLPILGGTMQGAIDMGGFALTNLPAGVGSSAARQTELDATQAEVDALEVVVAALDVTPTSQEVYGFGEDITLTAGKTVTWTQPLDEAAFRVFKSGTGAGTVIDIENDGTGIAVNIKQDGAAIAVSIDQNGDAVGVSLDMVSTTVNHAVQITHNAVPGTARDINGTGGLWFVKNSGVARFNRFGMTEQSQTISGGAIVLGASGLIVVDTESAAASDNLDTVLATGDEIPVVGDILIIRAANDARTVVITESGNFKLVGGVNITLDNTGDLAVFIYLGSWTEITRANIGA